MVGINSYSDEELVELFRSGSDEAFDEIFRRYWEMMLNQAYQRLQSTADAEEVVQDVFLNLYRRRKSLPSRLSLGAYIKAALKYKVVDSYRSRQLYCRYLEEAIHEQSAGPVDPGELMEVKEIRERVLLLAGRLPPQCREVFVLSRVDELSNKEIAARLSISVKTVKSHLNKALKFMRKEMG